MNVIATYETHGLFDNVMTVQEQGRLDFLWNQGIIVEQITLACPVQWEGTVDDHALYYRSRSNHWSVEIDDQIIYEGEDNWFGFTPPHIALAHIWQAVKAWRKVDKS